MFDDPRTNDLSPAERIAFPFLEAAVLLDRARQAPSDYGSLLAALDNNGMVWTYLRRHRNEVFDPLPESFARVIDDIDSFMTRATASLLLSWDDALLDKMGQLNLNMSEQVLEIGSRDGAAAA